MVVSLDTELMPGVRDTRTIETYGRNILGGRDAIPKLLELFSHYHIHATWAVVGMLLARNKAELERFLPEQKPTYADAEPSNYHYLDAVGPDEHDDPCNYLGSLIDVIRSYPGQEIGSHTFAHYYCLADGQLPEQFQADLQAAKNITERRTGRLPTSLVLPRNECNPSYLPIMKALGFTAYRGWELSKVYDQTLEQTNARRLLRLMDAYLNLTGMHCYPMESVVENGIANVRSSRFYRAYSPGLSVLEPLKLRRIRTQMECAARNGLVFHIWWHPHNLGVHTERNLKDIRSLFEYYSYLHRRYGFRSKNMGEIAVEALACE